MTAIKNTLEQFDLRDAGRCRQVFSIVVAWPETDIVTGPGDVEALINVLQKAAEMLANDKTVMPDSTREAIARVLCNPVEPNATFAHGTKVVWEYREHWRAMYHALSEQWAAKVAGRRSR